MRRVTLTKLLLPLLALSATSCGTGPFANPFVQPIEVTLNPSDLTLTPGTTARVQVTGRVAGNGQAVTGLTLKAEEVPAGLQVTPSTGAIVVTAQTDAAEGTYAVPLTATTPGGRGQAVLAVTVGSTTAATYRVTFIPETIELAQGQSVRVALNAQRGTEAASDVRVLSVQGDLNAGVTSDGLGVSVAASATQQTGSYLLQVTTTDGHATQTTRLPVTVTAKETQQ